MSALDIAPQAGRVPSLAVRARDVLVSEWTKVRSVRSSYWILLIAAVTAIGGSVIVAIATASSGHSPMDPLASIFLAWLEYPVLAVGILGVLAFTSEYSTGQIRTTLAAVPQRRAVLAAKAAAVGLLTLCFGELLAFISFFLSEAILSGHHRGLSLTHPAWSGLCSRQALRSSLSRSWVSRSERSSDTPQGPSRAASGHLPTARPTVVACSMERHDRPVHSAHRLIPDCVAASEGWLAVTQLFHAGGGRLADGVLLIAALLIARRDV